MPRKKILIFNDCFYMGGTEILLVNLLNHLNKKGCDVTLLLPNPSEKNELLERISKDFRIKYFHTKELKGLKKWIYKNILIFYPRIFAKLTGFNVYEYDEIVCFKDGFYSILFSKINLPKYLWVHNQPFVRDYRGKNLKEKLSYALNKRQIKRMHASFDKFDRVICVSDSCKREYIDIYYGGIPQKNIEVLYNALDLSGITERAKESSGLPEPERFSFVVVIRLSYEKTVDRVIIAADKLLKDGYDLEMHILGDGTEYDNLMALITELGRNDRITMHGRVGNPFPYMKRADWFICPSSRESFALTLLESIAIGTPIITTSCGGPEDVIMQGKYGVFVENSLEGVIEGMKKVMDNPGLRPYYSATAEENLSRFSYSHWLKAVDEILGV